MSNYNPYKDVPADLIPTRPDETPLADILRYIKEAIKIRHDFHTAVDMSDKANGVLRLHAPNPQWESNFAQTVRPDSKTLAGLAAEHKRIALEAQSYVVRVLGNVKLARLLRENLRSLFPDIGFRESTGEPLRRLVRQGKSVLQIFDPLGVEDNARLIRLLIKPPVNYGFYW